MCSLLRQIAIGLLCGSAGVGWCGLVTLNSGDGDYTEQFWFVAIMLFAASYLAVVLSAAAQKWEDA